MSKTALLRSALLTLACATALAGRVQADELKQIDVPAGDLTSALESFAKQAGVELVYETQQLKGLRTSGVSGTLSPQKAVTRLLEGTKLIFRTDPQSGAMLIALPRPDKAVGRNANGDAARIRLAQAQTQDQTQESMAGSGSADTTAAAGAADSGLSLTEVIVTATRRAENIQDIPLSIAAVDSEEIAKRNLVSQSDLLRSIPGVSQIESGAGGSFIIMRGIAADPANEGYSLGLTTGVFLGEVPVSAGRVGQTDLRLVDIERVEVLRGPQGTQFGSGSISGTLRYIPKAPDLTEASGELKAGYSHTGGAGADNTNVQGVFNLPLIDDTLAVRAVAYRFDNGGYIKNIGGRDPAFIANAQALGIPELLSYGNVGDTEAVGGRVTALWQLSDDLSVTLTFLKQKLEQDGTLEVQTVPVGDYYPTVGGHYDQTRLLFTNAFGRGEFRGDDTSVANALVQYQTPWGELLSSSSYSDQSYRNINDIGFYFVSELHGNPHPQDYTQQSRSFVQELRFTSSFDGPFGLIAGLYYEDAKAHRKVNNAWGGTLAALEQLFPENAGDRSLGRYDWRNNVKQKAAYGELSYEIVAGLKATAGARAFRYETEVPIVASGVMFGGGFVSDNSARHSGEVFKANLSYEPNADSLVYATWSQGFRLGFPQAPLPSSCDLDGDGMVDGLTGIGLNSNVKNDSVDNYELGGKFGLFDSRVRINAAVYDIEWQGIPVSVLGTCGIGTTVNAGKARARGVELESKIMLMRGLTLSLSAAYTSSKLVGDNSIGPDGSRLPATPEYSGRAALDYDFELAGRPTYVQGDLSYVGGFYPEVNQQGPELGDYTLLGLRGGMVFGPVDVSLFIDNLTNQRQQVWAVSSSGTANILRPITAGMNLRYSF